MNEEGKPLGRLARFLLAKAIIEALLVGALAVWFYVSAFPPFFRGAVDVADRNGVAGWAINSANPQGRVEVQLYIDGRFVAHTIADQPRPDVRAAGRAADENCGFRFAGPFALDAGPHEARVYVVHTSNNANRRTLQLLGKALTFAEK